MKRLATKYRAHPSRQHGTAGAPPWAWDPKHASLGFLYVCELLCCRCGVRCAVGGAERALSATAGAQLAAARASCGIMCVTQEPCWSDLQRSFRRGPTIIYEGDESVLNGAG